MRQAKARAAAQGESLKTLLTRAVAAELGKLKNLKEAGVRVHLPLFGNNPEEIDRCYRAKISRERWLKMMRLAATGRERNEAPRCECLAGGMSWSRHSLHNSAKEWVSDAEQGDLAFCRVSQDGLPAPPDKPCDYSRGLALPRRRAWEVFDGLIADPRIRLLAEPQGIEPPVDRFLKARR